MYYLWNYSKIQSGAVVGLNQFPAIYTAQDLGVIIDGVRNGEWIYLPLGTTNYYSATAYLYNSQITTEPAEPFPACCSHQTFPSDRF
jgi:hypothetical protein